MITDKSKAETGAILGSLGSLFEGQVPHHSASSEHSKNVLETPGGHHTSGCEYPTVRALAQRHEFASVLVGQTALWESAGSDW